MRTQSLARSVLCAVALGLVLARPAQAQPLFSVASLQGTYTYVNSGDEVASFGLITFDGAGKLTVAIKVNGPGTAEARKLTSLTGTGTYTVDAIGMGVAKIQFEGTGEERNGTFDFVITDVDLPKNGPALATEVFAVQQVGGLHGQLVTPVWKRRAD